jgi:hypothetical protein
VRGVARIFQRFAVGEQADAEIYVARYNRALLRKIMHPDSNEPATREAGNAQCCGHRRRLIICV